MTKSKTLPVFVLVLLSNLASVAIHAQAGLGSMVGTVTDPTGAVVPSVAIRAVDHNTGAIREVTGNAQGYFVIPSLRPSIYDLTLSASGFAPFTRNEVTLLADQTLTLDVHLSISGATLSVSVEDISTTQVDTTTSTLSQVVEQKRIVDLPLNGR